jgi:beta-lactamase superfamily II metal-dependent hydrolase
MAKMVLAIVHCFAQLPTSHYYIGPQQLMNSARNRLTVLDVGAGGAAHLHASGADWLFDCGSERDYSRVVRDYLHSAGVNHLSGLLLSHGDSLHIAGAALLVRELPPDLIVDNPVADRSVVHRRLDKTFGELRMNRHAIAAGEAFFIGRQLQATVVFPPRTFAGATADDGALVVQLTIPPQARVLFMSDSGYATENALIRSGRDLRSDILIKGQHHSGKSGSEPFLDMVRPKLIIATSRDFPASQRIDDSWAAQVRARGIKLFRQDETGAVQIDFDEKGWRARAYMTGETLRSDSR